MSNRCANGAYLKWWLGADISAILSSSAELVEIVGEDIYPLVAPENTDGSFIVYRRSKYTREYGKAGLVDDKARAEIMIVSDNYETSCEIASIVDDILTGEHHSEEGYTLSFQLYDSEEGFEDLKYTQLLIFDVN